jgi:hypothetical protein
VREAKKNEMANSGQGRKTRSRELVSRSPEETPSATPQHSKIAVIVGHIGWDFCQK